mmetsp:Transcript_5041/g.7001  ORF Transcript_5041/g.7001 Transcript_5041/m.7001 type:complete len:89 (-) Transcript_5041:24-290(-)
MHNRQLGSSTTTALQLCTTEVWLPVTVLLNFKRTGGARDRKKELNPTHQTSRYSRQTEEHTTHKADEHMETADHCTGHMEWTCYIRLL